VHASCPWGSALSLLTVQKVLSLWTEQNCNAVIARCVHVPAAACVEACTRSNTNVLILSNHVVLTRGSNMSQVMSSKATKEKALDMGDTRIRGKRWLPSVPRMTRTHTTVIAHFNIDMLSMSFISARLCLCTTFSIRETFCKLAISIRAIFFERSVFWSLFARLPLWAAFSIRESFWKTRNLYSRALLCAQCFLFASHVANLAISIRAPFFQRSAFYSRDNLNTLDLYSRAGVCICKFDNEFFDILIVEWLYFSPLFTLSLRGHRTCDSKQLFSRPTAGDHTWSSIWIPINNISSFHVRLRFILRSAKNVAAPFCTVHTFLSTQFSSHPIWISRQK